MPVAFLLVFNSDSDMYLTIIFDYVYLFELGPSVDEFKFTGDRKAFINDVRDALFASKIVSYAQGFALLNKANQEYKWDMDFSSVALMWRGGCIIRSVFLGNIAAAFTKNNNLTNLLLDDFFAQAISRCQGGWRRTLSYSVMAGLPCPAFATALAYYDGYRSARLPANLLQAQRDYFGAHQYERIDKPAGVMHHTNWTGRGGTTASSTYNV